MTGTVWPADDPRWEDDAATVRFGPPPPPLARPRAATRRSAWPRRLIIVALILAAAGSGHHLFTGRGVEGRPGPVSNTMPSDDGCAVVPPDPPDRLAQVIVVDVDGPCPWIVTYDRRTAILDLGERGRYRVGEKADVLLVGDWDCDGRATPGLYRPADGRTFQFSSWSDGEAVTSNPAVAAAPDGTPRVERQRGCDHLVVEAPA